MTSWVPIPAEYLIRATGDWTLRFLCLTLAVTPLRVITATPALARFRRMLGLFAYFYVVLHLLCYSWFDMGFDVADIARDIAKRPFILVGFTAFLLLTPLAATSFNRAIRALGAARWQMLHKAVYVVAALAMLHFFWMRAARTTSAKSRCMPRSSAGCWAGVWSDSPEEKDSSSASWTFLAIETGSFIPTKFRYSSGPSPFHVAGSRRATAPSTSTSAARPRVL